MPRGKRIKRELALQVKTLSDLGKTQTEIAKTVGVPQTTISDIMSGKGRWAQIQHGAWFETYRRDQKKKLQTASLELSWKALEQVEETLPNANSLQAATTYGILRDRERLDAGEATQHVAVVARVEVDALNETLGKLIKSLAKES